MIHGDMALKQGHDLIYSFIFELLKEPFVFVCIIVHKFIYDKLENSFYFINVKLNFGKTF